MMLCCLHDGFNGTVGLSLSQVFLESISEDGQLTIGLEGRRKVFWASSRPAAVHLSAISACLQRLTLRVTWRTVPSAFSTMLVQARRAPEFVRQAEADDGEDLVQPLQDAARDARFPHAPDAGPGCAAAVRPCLRRPGPRPDGAPS